MLVKAGLVVLAAAKELRAARSRAILLSMLALAVPGAMVMALVGLILLRLRRHRSLSASRSGSGRTKSVRNANS